MMLLLILIIHYFLLGIYFIFEIPGGSRYSHAPLSPSVFTTWSDASVGSFKLLLGNSGCHGPSSKYQGVPRTAKPLCLHRCLQRGLTRHWVHSYCC